MVPNLRFWGFEGEWEIKCIGKYIELISGYAFKGDDISEDENGIPLLRGINITEGRIRHNKEIDRYFNGNTDHLERYFIREGDLVIGMDGSKVGKNVALIKKEDSGALLIQRVARLRAKDNSDINFIYQNINNSKFHKYVDIVNTSSGIPHISSEQINEYEVGFPTLSEQTKIASFLSLIDERIQAQSKIIEGLRVLKTAISKKIFSQQLRFGRFSDEWETKKLCEVAENIQSGKDKPDSIGNVPVYGSMGVIGYGSKISYEQENILIARVGANAGSLNLINGKYAVTDNTLVLSLKKSTNLKFIYYLLESSNLNKLVFGSGQPLITGGQLKSLYISIPDMKEQTRITNFLSSIDEKIEAERKILLQYESQKKYLLQNMFI